MSELRSDWLVQLRPVHQQGQLSPLLETLVNTLPSPASQRAYLQAYRHFYAWTESQPDNPGFSRDSVLRYRASMTAVDEYGKTPYSPATANLRLAALRALAAEAAERGLLSPAAAHAISRVKSIKLRGQRLGVWLPPDELHKLLTLPDTTTLLGLRDRALLMVAFGCGLRRKELSTLSVNHIQFSRNRWGLVDLLSKGNRTRSVPLPDPARAALDQWLAAAKIAKGFVFRPITRHAKIGDTPLTGDAILQIIKGYGLSADIKHLRPHDARRTFAHLCRERPGTRLEDIQELMGHASADTTRRYFPAGESYNRAPNQSILD
jgi:integrase